MRTLKNLKMLVKNSKKMTLVRRIVKMSVIWGEAMPDVKLSQEGMRTNQLDVPELNRSLTPGLKGL